MKLSEKWLKKYIDFNFAPEKLAEKLSMLGLEVESYEDLAKKYDKFVVGEVLECMKHPNADRLSVCRVDTGTCIKELVCGAPNVAAGQKVAVALEGAVIQHNMHAQEGKPFVIAKTKIRGVESDGMICSELELGLGKNADGILVLDEAARVGIPLAKYLGRTDVVYEIGITPNRADCLSHIGVAREIGLLVNKKLKLPKISLKEGSSPTSKNAKIKIMDARNCPRYSARVIRGIKLGPSPKWLQDMLTSVGVRPINNIVDITNFVLMETGQPLHAFDYDKLAGHTIIVRRAAEGEKFVTLDGKERILTSETLMICDAEKPVAVAGVMGGANTEISDSTCNILIESAYFNPVSIRKTSKHLGLSTEASYRFERGADPDITVTAANRAAQLVLELAGGRLLKDALDAYPGKRKPLKVRARVSRINSVTGLALKKSVIANLLKKIGMGIKSSAGDELLVTVPTFRSDVTEEIDIIEEVARTYGYNNIETKTRAAIDFSANVRTDLLQNEIREYLIGAGFNEILTIALQDEETAALAGKPAVKILNPVSAEMAALRTSLVTTALRVVQHNRNHGLKDLRLFEMGTVFRKNSVKEENSLENYPEEERLLTVLTGNNLPAGYGNSPRLVDLLDLKGELEALLTKFCLDNYRFIYYDTHDVLTEPGIGIEINGTYAGFFGKVRKELAAKLDIDDPVYICELSVRAIDAAWVRERKFTPLPKFPGVTRDLAFTVDASVPQEAVENTILQAGRPLCVGVILFDMYSGQQTGTGKKSLAYTVEFRSAENTLTDNEIDNVVSGIVESVRQKCNGVLRS